MTTTRRARRSARISRVHNRRKPIVTKANAVLGALTRFSRKNGATVKDLHRTLCKRDTSRRPRTLASVRHAVNRAVRNGHISRPKAWRGVRRDAGRAARNARSRTPAPKYGTRRRSRRRKVTRSRRRSTGRRRSRVRQTRRSTTGSRKYSKRRSATPAARTGRPYGGARGESRTRRRNDRSDTEEDSLFRLCVIS